MKPPAKRSRRWSSRLAREPFAGGALLAVPGKTDTPVALAGDRDRLAGSGLVLEYLLGLATTARRPLAVVGDLQELLNETLRPAFAESVGQRLTAGTLPEGVGAFTESARGRNCS